MATKLPKINQAATRKPKSARVWPAKVSPLSRWTDRKWKFPNLNAGSDLSSSTIDWDVLMPDSSSLLDAKWSNLLQDLRCFVWSLLTDKRQGHIFSAGSMASVDVFIGILVPWMAGEGYLSLSELGTESGDEFLDYLECEYVSGSVGKGQRGRRRVWDFSAAHRLLNLYILIHRQRLALKRLGVTVDPKPPFGGATANHVVVHRLGFKNDGSLKAFDDEAFIEIVNTSFRMLGTPAEDVIRLQSEYLAAYELDDRTRSLQTSKSLVEYAKYNTRVSSVIAHAAFGTIEGEQAPWHGPLVPYSRTLRCGRVVYVEGTQLIRRLIMEVQSAAQLVLQGLTAPRASDICAAEVEPPVRGRLPSCIRLEHSLDGTMDVFYFESVENKITHQKARWPLGSRPIGTHAIPPAVQAVDVLSRLLEPWRKLAGTRRLLVTFSASRGLPKQSSSVGMMTADTMTNMGKDFILANCDRTRFSPDTYSDIVEDVGFRGHRFRKTFARFVFRSNSRLLAAISSHFKHLSIAMTEQRYIGADVELLEAMDSERVYATAQLIRSLLSGEAPATGKGAKLIRQHAGDISASIDSKVGSSDLERTIRFVEDEEILIWPSGSGDCLINIKPRSAACHAAAATTSWRQRVPNHEMRTPNLCLGCPCNIVTSQHLPYWKAKATTLKKTLAENVDAPDWDAFYAVRKEAQQAESLVRIHTRRAKE